jgi:predicted ATPase/DNA-binding CsgD family transcriptional regulator
VTQTSLREESGLPHELTSFVGRRQMAAEVRHALSESRLVTLTGFGGMGKSRLALHVAHMLRRAFPDGVYLVELAEVQDPALVPHAVAVALGLRDRSTRDLETVLADYLADKQLLLLLDNCEHLLDACGGLTARLLTAAGKLRVLATSREPLGIAAEHVWPVPPLPVPDGDEPTLQSGASAQQQAALTLFEDRAAAVRPGFVLTKENAATVARLCQRLDGIPLAIELAAVRVRMLSVDEILAHVENRFQLLTSGHRTNAPRHQTLRAAVDWSFDLCTEQERKLWACCSVFVGEFDLDAAESVCADETLTTDDVFAGIAGLVDKSVLLLTDRGRRTRYRMLDTIRQYGREKLVEAGAEAGLRRRHRDHYLLLAEESERDSAGSHQADWVTRLRAERANFWAALDYCLTTPGESRTGLRMATALWFYWVACGFVRDGRMWLERALAQNTEPTHERAKALWIAGHLAHLGGDRTGTVAYLREGRDLARELDDQEELTYAFQFLGDAEMWNNNLELAAPLLDEALERHRAAGSWTAAALLIFALQAQISGLLGDVDRAAALLEEARGLCERSGERWVLSWTEWNVGITWWVAGAPDKAAVHLTSALRKKHQLDDELGIANCLELLSWVAVADGDAQRAAVLSGAAGRLWEKIGRPLFGSETLLSWSRDASAQARKALGAKGFEEAQQRGAQLPFPDVIDYALGNTAAGRKVANATATPEPSLTKREREVAQLVAAGKSNKEIAAQLVISQRTAEAHVEHILAKLGFNSRVQIASWQRAQQG